MLAKKLHIHSFIYDDLFTFSELQLRNVAKMFKKTKILKLLLLFLLSVVIVKSQDYDDVRISTILCLCFIKIYIDKNKYVLICFNNIINCNLIM